MKVNAREFVSSAIAGLTPPDIPTPFTGVTRARMVGRNKAVAEIALFNGTSGTMMVSKEHLDILCFQWVELSTPFYWDGAKWVTGDLMVI